MQSKDRASLFRIEAMDGKNNEALGHVVLVQPISLWLLSATFIVGSILFLIFLYYGQFGQRITVNGMLVPDQGLLKIQTPHSGIVVERKVKTGQVVAAGEILYILSSETIYSTGANDRAAGAVSDAIDTLKARDSNLHAEEKNKIEEAALEVSGKRKAASSLESAIHKLDNEIYVQNERAALAEQQFQLNAEAQSRGFISGAALQQKRVDVLDQQGRLISLERTKIGLRAELTATQEGIKLLESRVISTRSQLERQRLEINQELISRQSAGRVLITAPQAGEVATAFAEVGQTVDKQALLSIIPQNSLLEAHLFVPSSTIAHIKINDKVRLRLAPFQNEQFGSVDGFVLEISNTTVAVPEEIVKIGANGNTENNLYHIRVSLPSQFFVSLSGIRYKLRPGMLLEADVLKEKRSLLQWIFKPMYDLRNTL